MIISSMDFNRNPSKRWDSTERHLFNKIIGNFGWTINSNFELAHNNFGVEYFIENSTPKSVGVDFKILYLKLAHIDFGMEST